MPIHRGSVTFARYRIEPESGDLKRLLARGLKSHAFEPLDPKSEDARSAGFAEIEDPDATSFPVGALFHGHRVLFTWRVDTIKVPGGQLKTELQRWAQEFEREQGRKPARSEKNERKAALRQMLRSRAVPVTKTHDLAWNAETCELQIWSGSRKVIDEIVGALESAFNARVVLQVPSAMAASGEHKGVGLKPTAELMGSEVMEVVHGAA